MKLHFATDRVRSLVWNPSKLPKLATIRTDNIESQPKPDPFEVSETMPIEELQALVDNMRAGLRTLVLFVCEQEEELAIQAQYVKDLEIRLTQVSDRDRFDLEIDLANERENKDLLEATVVGQRRNLRKLEIIYNQHWRILQRRKGSVTLDDNVVPFVRHQEQTRELTTYREPQSRRSNSLILLLGIAIGIGISAIGSRLLAPSGNNAVQPNAAAVTNPKGTARSVTVAEVELSRVARTLKATGSLAAFEMIPVMSQAQGLQIQKVLVDEGEFVRAGQLLVQLDDSVLQAQLVQAQASEAEAEARLSQLRAGSRAEEIARAQESVTSAQAAVVQAKSDWELAKKRVDRNQNLELEGAIARDRLDEIVNEERTKQSAYNSANAKLREAQQQLAEVKAGPRQEEIAQAAAQLAQAKAQVQSVLAQLKDTRIVAPASGKIAERNARIGDIASDSQRLFTIIENGRLELRVKIPETQLSLVRIGQSVEITSDADSRIKLTGRVREINPVVNEESRQATLEVDLPADSSLKPGMFLRASITTNTATSLTIPMGAVLPQSDGNAIVYVLQSDNTVKERQVKTGEILSGERVEVISGLEAGDRAIVKGAAYLKDGDRVSVNSKQ